MSAKACDIQQGQSVPPVVEIANNAIASGTYIDFVNSIDPFNTLDAKISQSIVDGLTELSQKGFDGCIVLETTGQDGLFSKGFVFYYTGKQSLFVFYGAALMDGEWKIIKSKFSSNFDEIYETAR